MPSGFVGQAWIQVSPSFTGFQRQVGQQVSREMSGVGETAGRDLASSIAASLGRGAVAVGRAAANMAGVATAALVGFAAANVQTYVRARQFENALQLVGDQMGVSNTVVQEGMRRMTAYGASNETARNTMMAFIRTGGDATQAWKLYQRAEDIAVTTGRDGNEVMQELIYGLQTGNTNLRIFRDINLNATQAQDKYAASIGKSRSELTDAERQTALFNAVMERTGNIAGVAGRMMQEGPFNWNAMRAPIQNLREAMGGLLEPAFSAVGRQVYQLATQFNSAISEGGKFYPIVQVIRDIFRELAEPLARVVQRIREFIEGVRGDQVAGFASALRGLAPVLPGIATALSVFAGQNLLKNIPIVGDQFSNLLGKLGPVKGGIIALALSFPPVQEAIGKVLGALSPLIGMLGGVFSQVIAKLMPPLEKLARALLEPLIDIIKALAPPLETLIQALNPVLVLIAGLVAWLVKLIAPYLKPLVYIFGAIAAVIGVLTIAWWAWNAALIVWAVLTSPITWIILAIVAAIAAVVAVVVLLWRNWETIWNAIVAAAQWVWNTILQPIFSAIATAWSAMVGAIKWFWDNVLYPVFEAVWTIVSILFRIWIAPILLAIWLAWQAMSLAFQFIWNYILKPVFDAVMAVVSWLWNVVLRPIFNAIQLAWNLLVMGIKWFWDTILKPVFDAVGSVVSWLWNNIIRPAWEATKIMWGQLAGAIEWVWKNIIEPVFNAIKTAVDAVKRAFEAAKDGIAKAWDAVRDAVKKPIKWVIDVIVNNFIKGVNWIISKFGIPEIPTVDTSGWAEGGRIPGPRGRPNYGGGDIVPAFLEPGEFVLTKRQARAIGYDRLRNLPRFASGGVVGGNGAARSGAPYDPWAGIDMAWWNPKDWIKAGAGLVSSGFGALADLGGDIFNSATKLLRHGVAAAFEKGLAPLRELINHIPLGDTGWAQDIKAGVLWIMDRVVEWVRGHEEAPPQVGGMAIDDIVAQVLSNFPSLRVTSALRPGDPGYHGRNLARDLGGAGSVMAAAGTWIKDTLAGALLEGIHNPTLSVKNGKVVDSGFWGPGTWGSHRDHIHLAAEAGASGDVQTMARQMVDQRWPGQWGPFAAIVQSESGWNPRAVNASSGAFGLGQALPASKIDAFGNRNDPGAQLRWMMDYIAGRYGDPRAAKAFWDSHRWYDQGGWLPPGASIAVNATGKPEPVLTPGQWDDLSRAARQDRDNTEIVELLKRIAGGIEAGQSIVIDGAAVARVVDKEMAWVH